MKNVYTIMNNISRYKILDFIQNPVLSYKACRLLTEKKQYMFDVDIRLTKSQIKQLFELSFGVQIVSINTHIPPRKKRQYISNSTGFKNRYKRVIVRLQNDQSIPVRI